MNITHQPALTDIQVRDEPGAFNLVRTQPFTAVGRGLGLLCLLGTGTSLFFATQPEAEKESAIVSRRSSRARSLPQPQSVQTWDDDANEFDEDVDIDPEGLEPSSQTQPSSPGAVNIFELMYSHRKRHLFVPAETGAGKTTLLLGAIEYGHRRFPEIEFFGSTAKVSPWLGLEEQRAEDGKPRILTINPDEPETILPLVARLNWLRRRLRKRGEQRLLCEQQNKPYRPRRNVIVLEEWNETLATALRYDRAFNAARDKDTPASTVHANLVDAIESFARCGREDEMAIWIFAQDHQVQNAAINTGYRKNFGFVVPGRANGGMAGLEDAFLGKSPIVAAGMSKKLMSQAETLAQEVAALNPERGMVYSNLAGHEMLPVPDLPDIKRKRLFAAGEQPKRTTNVVQFQPPQPQFQAPMQAPIAVNDDEDYWED